MLSDWSRFLPVSSTDTTAKVNWRIFRKYIPHTRILLNSTKMDSWGCLFAALAFILGVHGGETQSSTVDKLTSAQGQCVQPFRPGRDDFVLDTEESIEDGAAFLSNPSVAHRNACIAACCRDSRCNLALIEDGHEKGSNSSCFLFNCLYKQKYVCRFVQKKGFTNYILDSVYEYYLNGRKSGKLYSLLSLCI